MRKLTNLNQSLLAGRAQMILAKALDETKRSAPSPKPATSALLFAGADYVDPMPASDTSTISLLGRSETRLPSSPEEAQLEFFANRHAARDYWIHLDCKEFSSLCPVTGQPDMASIQIRYVPDEKCVEAKTLKFYLAAFRNTPSFNEDIVNRILNDLVVGCSPRRMVVRGTFGAWRGWGFQQSHQAMSR